MFGWLFLAVFVCLLLAARHFIRQAFLPFPAVIAPKTVPGRILIDGAPKSVLVTGAAGFVGRYLVETLLAKNDVRAKRCLSFFFLFSSFCLLFVVRRRDERSPKLMFDFFLQGSTIICCDIVLPRAKNPRCICIELDLSDERAVDAFFAKNSSIDVVYHIAGVIDTRNGPLYEQKVAKNVTMARAIGRAVVKHCRSDTKLISLSSSASGVFESAYGASKRHQQVVLQSLGAMLLRPWKIYGVGDSLGTDHTMSTKKPVVMLPDGKTGLIYVRNLCALLLECEAHFMPGEVLDAADTCLTKTYLDLNKGILMAAGRSTASITIVPNALALIVAYVTPLVDWFVTLCLDGRAPPLLMGLMLNPVVLKRLTVDPGDGWRAERAHETLERLGGSLPFPSWDSIIKDIAVMHKTPPVGRFPLTNSCP